MKNFLISKRIALRHDQNLEEIKEFLKATSEQSMDIHDISAGLDHFYIKGSTGALFDFIRRAKIFAEFDMIAEDNNTGKDLRLIAKGNAHLTLSLTIFYFVLFFAVLLAGLLPGSIETNGVESSAIDALVFLLIGYYIKTDIDKGLDEAEKQLESTIEAVQTRFGI